MQNLTIYIFLLSAAIGISASAQPGPPQNRASELLKYGELAYVEVVNMPSDSAGFCKIDVMVRIANDFMVFTRTDNQHPDSAFSGGVTLALDIKKLPDDASIQQMKRRRIEEDSDPDEREFKEPEGEYVASTTDNISVFTRDYSNTNTRDAFVLLRKSVYVDSGRYVFKVVLEDEQSTREKKFDLPILAESFFSESITLGSIIPLEVGEGVEPLGYGGRFLFAKPSTMGVTAAHADDVIWAMELYELDPQNGEKLLSSTAMSPAKEYNTVTSGSEKIQVPNYTLNAMPDLGEKRYKLNTGVGRLDTGKYKLKFPVNVGTIYRFSTRFDTLDVGKYRVKITAKDGDRTDSLVQIMEVFWKDMPLSLYDIDFATELMRYILTEDEYDDMTSGSRKERERKLKAYWEEHDPTPKTAYNERMYEYFRRVDEAYFQFQTTKQINGALTDRGKVFILYGEPKNIVRRLAPDEPATEIWEYPSLEKTFRFIDRERSNNYRLAQ